MTGCFPRACVAVAFLSLTALAAHADEPYRPCVDCHGESGASTQAQIPNIGGVSSFYLETALQVYQEGGRSCPEAAVPSGAGSRPHVSMCEIAKDLSGDQLQAVVTHYSEQHYMPAQQDVDPALVDRGRTLHEQHCAKCHTDNGANAEDDAGILAGQWMPYLETCFQDFRSGKRVTLKKMQQAMDALSDQDVEALICFYASQK